jgi:predicted nucleic acid-binding protein
VLYLAEPAGAYTVHPPAVIDCSLMSAMLWAEPSADAARERTRGRALHAPTLLTYELANVARNKCRSGVPEAVVREGLAAFADHRVALHDDEPNELFGLAHRLGLTAYDAAYLCLSMALRAPLLTFDEKLAAAARTLGGGE